jgi:hypothetical protein
VWPVACDCDPTAPGAAGTIRKKSIPVHLRQAI